MRDSRRAATRLAAAGLAALACWAGHACAGAGRVGGAPSTVDLPPALARELHERTCDAAVFIDAEKALRRVFGDDLQRISPDDVSGAIVGLAESLPPGGAIDLPRSVPAGRLDFRGVADGVQITRGWGGRVVLGPGQRGLQMLFMDLDQEIAAADVGGDGPADASAGAATRPKERFGQVAIMDRNVQPASDLLALFCTGGIRIRSDVRNCAWICGANAFGARTVTADARVDDCLFLWFGINWPFADYNAHRNPKNAGCNWLDNAQMWFNCHGGGRGTRLYLMVETNYGNPGPGVVLENCEGLALYNGTTERASSQGAGIYWLKNCRRVQLGIRGINAFAGWNARGADPAHDITIEGGRGNILHAMRIWGNASQASVVNSDPELQVWMTSVQFEAEGVDRDGVARFCYTPKHQAPSEELLAKIRPELKARAAKRVRELWGEATPGRLADMERQILAGRSYSAPFNASQEQTFVFAGRDLTKGAGDLPGGRKLPAPPSVPPTDAPRLRRPLAFTRAAGFGKALLDAGADPAGKAPSDDAFAKLMFDMTREQVDVHYRRILAEGQKYQAARAKADQAAMDTALKAIQAEIDQLCPFAPADARGRRRRIQRPPIEVPAGTFRLTRPLLVWTNGWFMGAGPDRTVIQAAGDFTVIKQIAGGTIGNFTVEGGRTGLAVTGVDHGSRLPPPLKSYIAGSNYYNITFRNQSFAGLHLGNDDPTVMGGAEFDQNKFVDLRFYHTGEYGIYNNAHMLDKWLCLHGHFEGQKKAGIAVKFNCVIKGGIYGCTFKDIDGPGIDILSGSPAIALRPAIVTVDQCEFDECGSRDAPAVDLGYNALAMFTHSRITTRTKQIKTGWIGAPQIVEDIDVDVKLPAGHPGVILRAVRNNSAARANGQVLRDVRANGPVAFINDANDHNEVFEPTRVKRGIGKGKDINWDNNSAAYRYPPPNGWVHPFVFYNCTFGDRRYAYHLLNVDPKRNKVLDDVDLSPLSRPARPAAAGAERKGAFGR